ncbi:MAG: YihY/virulence factor BrkB family protein [Bacteroidales bacterium]
MFKKIKDYILQLRFVRLTIIFLKRVSLPGFDKIPIYYVIKFFLKGLFKGDITQRAASLSFTFFLAIFPALLALFSFIPYLPIDNFVPTLLTLVEDIMPEAAWQIIEPIINDILLRQRGGLMSISFLISLFLTSNGVMAISRAFNRSYYNIETRTALKQRLMSFYLIFIISLLIVLAIASIGLGRFFLKYLESHELISGGFMFKLLVFIKWLIVMLLIFFAISFIYYLAPSNKKYYKFISAGSSLATFMSLMLMVGFDYYISNFTRYNALYGSIGTLIGLMMWLYFNSILLLIGFELNVSILKAREELKKIS